MSTRITVLGDGAMGTACALLLNQHSDHEVTIWSAFAENCQLLRERRENVTFLPGIPIPPRINLTSDFKEVRDADAFVMAVPAVYLSKTLERLAPDWPRDGLGAPIVSVIKGIEQGTLRTPSQMIEEVLGPRAIVVLCGPSHAEEIALGKPASVVAASPDRELARRVQHWFTTGRFRVYTSSDLWGTEISAALKNVIAIAAGICDGLGMGDNAKSALMTRGLVEMIRFGTALGAETETFFGLAGIGDLITTCVSPHGRNLRVGRLLGEGKSLDEILGMKQVAEGVWTARSVHDLAQQKGIDMPVTGEVYRILFEGKDPRQAADDLMARAPKGEWDD